MHLNSHGALQVDLACGHSLDVPSVFPADAVFRLDVVLARVAEHWLSCAVEDDDG